MYKTYIQKNYKTLVDEIKELSKGRALLCSWIERFNAVKMSVLPNRLIDSIQSQSKSQQAFLKIENGKFIIKCIWKCKGPEDSK